MDCAGVCALLLCVFFAAPYTFSQKQDCTQGFYGVNCSTPCDDRCDGGCSTDVGHCTRCKAGFWGSPFCHQNCSENCAGGTCERTDGSCDGCRLRYYYGAQCRRECTDKTARCNTCVQNGTCTDCLGWLKPPNCTECYEGTYLSDGSCHPCSACKTGKCNETSGFCDDCRRGYYKQGVRCKNCNYWCTAGQCDPHNGTCDSCQPGHYGDRCEGECSDVTEGCSECHRNGTCTVCGTQHYQPPLCTECMEGFYKSDSSCYTCDTCKTGECNQTSGICDECKEGYYKSGRRCVLCSESCAKGLCDPVNGTCYDCEPDHYRTYKTCTPCDRRCKDRRCDVDTASCVDCNFGHYKSGTTCVQCSYWWCRTGQCRREDGTCDGCRNRHWGGRCERECGGSCLQCTQDTGQCTECSGFTTLPDCNECLDGYFKERYNSTSCTECTWRCVNDTLCNKTTGDCEACPPGKTGKRCDKDVDTGGREGQGGEESASSSAGVIVGAVLGVVVVVAVVATAVICWRRRSARWKSGDPPSMSASFH